MRRSTISLNPKDLEDRLHRVQNENEHLKKERNELEEKLKRVKAQFQKLVEDWRRVQPFTADTPVASMSGSGRLPSIPSTKSTRARTSVVSASLHRSSTSVSPELEQCQAALASAREEIRQLQSRLDSAYSAPQDEVQLLRQRVIDLTNESRQKDAELVDVRDQLQLAHQNLQRFSSGEPPTLYSSALGSSPSPGAVSSVQAQTAEIRQRLQHEFEESTKKLREENDALSLQIRLYEAEKKHNEESAASVDPLKVVELQNEVRSKTNEISLLGSRFQYAQGQVETLKGECGRLVEELKTAHTTLAEVKREIFILEQEKSNLQVKCARLDETELTLQRRNEEIIKLEADLLKSVDSLNRCNRETETAVRRELQSRIDELQEMRDQADASRREKEKSLFELRRELDDAKNKIENLQNDVSLYKSQTAKVEKERAELAAQLEYAGRASTELNDDEIHRALAVATIKKRSEDKKSVDGKAKEEGKEAMELYEALQWDDNWEKAQLEEALSSAALDLELAETRCQQMNEQVEKGRESIMKLSQERDELLEENMEMRNRLRHVQTVFAKHQLQTYRTAVKNATDSANQSNGSISFYVREIQFEPAILKTLDIKDFSSPVSLFLSVDGLLEYDTMLSPLVHSLQEPVDIHFQYTDLDRTRVTVAELQRTTFTFQLHCAKGKTSTIIAMGELSGIALISAREMSQEEVLLLVDGDGNLIGRLVVEFACTRLMLPVLLGAPFEEVGGLSSAEVMAAMTALRSVRFLRVQVFKCEQLISQGTTPPQPYVFYTAQGPQGVLCCIRDTVVYPVSKSVTTDPVFDASPVDHRVIVDRDLVYFLLHGTVTFVVFDNTVKDIQTNIGIVEVPLQPLLRSVQASIQKTETLHPQGTITIGISWVS